MVIKAGSQIDTSLLTSCSMPHCTLFTMWFSVLGGEKIHLMLSSRMRKSFKTSYKLKAVECLRKSSKQVDAREIRVDAERIYIALHRKLLV